MCEQHSFIPLFSLMSLINVQGVSAVFVTTKLKTSLCLCLFCDIAAPPGGCSRRWVTGVPLLRSLFHTHLAAPYTDLHFRFCFNSSSFYFRMKSRFFGHFFISKSQIGEILSSKMAKLQLQEP